MALRGGAKNGGSPLLYVVMIFACIVMAIAVIHLFGLHYMLPQTKTEKFANELLPPTDFIVYQGAQMPISRPTNVEFDMHESYPTVDGTSADGTPRSMFMMAFNKCDPSCCPSSYSCNGGCVCMTDKQIDFIGKRGNNSASRCKFKDNPEY